MSSPFSRRATWIVALTLLALGTPVAGILYSYSAGGTPLPRGGGDAGPAPASGETGAVCFGHVDLEHGLTSLYPLQPGRVVEVLVHEGETVPAGKVLVRLEDGPAKSRVAEARAALEGAELRLARARKLPQQHESRIAQQKDSVDVMHHRLSAAQHLLERKRSLYKSESADATEVAAALDQVKELEALERVEKKRLADLEREDPLDDQRRAEAEVEAMRARLKQAEYALGDCDLKAPRPGTVLRLHVGPGDVLGAQSKQPAVVFAADGPQVIRAEVEQEFAGRVHAGQAALIQDEANPGSTWNGRVERVSNWFTQGRSAAQDPFQFNDVRTVECLVTLDSGQPPLRIGQRVRVLIGSARP